MNVGDNLDKIVDEYTYAELVDPDFYKERLRTHWDTFVTEDDFATLAGAGVSHVRVPIAYWLVFDLPYLSKLSGTGQLRKASRFPPQTPITTTLRTPSSS